MIEHRSAAYVTPCVFCGKPEDGHGQVGVLGHVWTPRPDEQAKPCHPTDGPAEADRCTFCAFPRARCESLRERDTLDQACCVRCSHAVKECCRGEENGTKHSFSCRKYQRNVQAFQRVTGPTQSAPSGSS